MRFLVFAFLAVGLFLANSSVTAPLLIPVAPAYAQDAKPGATPPWTIGPATAPVSLEIFNDYQCPPCVRLNPELNKLHAKYKDDLQIIFRKYPLRRIHTNAQFAAQAAEAAGLQGHFVEMLNKIYDNHKLWADSEDAKPLFMSYARQLNLDMNRFALDLDGPAVRDRIESDIERAESLEVKGTPTVFLNGKMVPGESYRDLSPVIDELLKQRRQ
jgi:protein-disulfide isomerase